MDTTGGLNCPLTPLTPKYFGWVSGVGERDFDKILCPSCFQSAFETFDENRDGKFDVNELVDMVDYIQDFNLEEFQDMVKDMQPDAVGTINYKDFVTKLQKHSI